MSLKATYANYMLTVEVKWSPPLCSPSPTDSVADGRYTATCPHFREWALYWFSPFNTGLPLGFLLFRFWNFTEKKKLESSPSYVATTKRKNVWQILECDFTSIYWFLLSRGVFSQSYDKHQLPQLHITFC